MRLTLSSCNPSPPLTHHSSRPFPKIHSPGHTRGSFTIIHITTVSFSLPTLNLHTHNPSCHSLEFPCTLYLLTYHFLPVYSSSFCSPTLSIHLPLFFYPSTLFTRLTYILLILSYFLYAYPHSFPSLLPPPLVRATPTRTRTLPSPPNPPCPSLDSLLPFLPFPCPPPSLFTLPLPPSFLPCHYGNLRLARCNTQGGQPSRGTGGQGNTEGEQGRRGGRIWRRRRRGQGEWGEEGDKENDINL